MNCKECKYYRTWAVKCDRGMFPRRGGCIVWNEATFICKVCKKEYKRKTYYQNTCGYCMRTINNLIKKDRGA